MSSYSLAEALNYSHYRSKQQQLLCDEQPTRSRPTAVCLAGNRRRKDEIVCLPVRPWHSPSRIQQHLLQQKQRRQQQQFSYSPPISHSQLGATSIWRHCQVQDAVRPFQTSHASTADSRGSEDCRSFGTYVSDTISHDPSVSHHFLCERSDRIGNGSNASTKRRRRRQRQQHHQGVDARRDCSSAVIGSGDQNWGGLGCLAMSQESFRPDCSSVCGGDVGVSLGCGYGRGVGGNLHGLCKLSVNANCFADQRSFSQRSDYSEPDFGREDVRVRCQWHDAQSHDGDGDGDGQSITLGTLTHDEEQTSRTDEPGSSDLSAMTLSRLELSSSQPVMIQCQQQNQHYHQQLLPSLPQSHCSTAAVGQTSPESTNVARTIPVDGSTGQQQQVRPQINGVLVGNEGFDQQMAELNRQYNQKQQLTPQQQYETLSQVHHEIPHQTQSSSQQQRHHQWQNYRFSHQRVTMNRRHARVTSAVSAAMGKIAIGQNSSNSSFSLNLSQRSSRGSTTAREDEAIPMSDDFIQLPVTSCSAPSRAGSEAEDTTAPAAETDADQGELGTTLCAESDDQRARGSAPTPDDHANRQKRRQQGHHQQRTTIPSSSTPTDSVQSSRFGRMKTPEICKGDFLSVLRHSISHSQQNRRAKFKPPTSIGVRHYPVKS